MMRLDEESMNPDGTAGFSLRDLLLGVMVIGMFGLIAELLLQEHTESWQQWIPLVALGLGLATTALVRLRPSRGTFRLFNFVMAAFLTAGLFGVYLHYAGNVEFALERTPELGGAALVWKALTGATPALAPGALAQLGLLGFIYTYRHPSSTQ
jgi:hypothetical protein